MTYTAITDAKIEAMKKLDLIEAVENILEVVTSHRETYSCNCKYEDGNWVTTEKAPEDIDEFDARKIAAFETIENALLKLIK